MSLLLLAVSLALVLGAVVLCVESEDGHAAVGDTFTADGITYKVMTVPEGENPGTVQVGDGSECAIDSSRATVVIPDTVVNGGESYDVIKIADEAFYKCKQLTSATIGSHVTHIGGTAFCDCSSLESVSLPESLEFIGGYAFSACSALKSVVIHEKVSTIEGDAFESCTSLESIAVDESNSHYESVDGVLFNQEKTVLIQYPSGKSGAYEVPGTVKTIRDSSFKSCAGLTDVTLNEGLETIGLYAFRSSGLTSISVPSTVTMIYTGAFRSCHNLSSIGVDEANTKYCSVDGVLLSKDKTSLKECPAGKAGAFVAPDEVKRVEIYAFYYCSELTSVTFGSNVTLIGSYSFTGCPVETVTLPDSVQMIDYYAFSDCGLKSIVIPDNIESLRYVFYNCRDLSSVTLPSELKIIGSYAFYNCRSLTSIDIPEKVTTLDNYAFYNCDGLESVRLPATVATVGDGVFGNCDNLMRIDADDANASFTSSGGVLFSKNMKTLVQYPCAITGDYAIPTGVEKIQAYAFCGSKASSVSIPDTVTSVGNRALQNCVNLTSMEIPASVASIGDRVFYVSYNIESIDVDDGNTSYHSIDGVLFDTGKKKLMLFPEAKVGTFTIPGDVTVDEYAFNNVCLAPGVVPAAGVTINTTGHDYEAVFAFSEDFKTCEITLTCRNNPDHVISTTVTTVIDGDDATATYVYHGMTYTKTVSMTDDPSDPDDDSGSKAPLFIGIGAVVGILAVAGAVVFIRRR